MATKQDYLFVKFIMVIALAISASIGHGQTVTINMDQNNGKDTYIDSAITVNPQNFFVNHGAYPHLAFGIDECFPDGFAVPCWYKTLLDFNLEGLNLDTSFTSAYLVLCAYAIIPNDATDSTRFTIRRITSPWKEDSVLWMTRPTVDSSMTTSFTIKPGMADSLVMDVTDLLKNLLLHQDSSYGFMIDYTVENMYGHVAGYASEYADATKRPKLVINFEPSTLQEVSQENFRVYPNPFLSEIIIVSQGDKVQLPGITVWNSLGQCVYIQGACLPSAQILNLNFLNPGIYFLELPNGERKRIYKVQ